MPHGTKDQPSRKSIRLKDYDYSQEGAYFVTVCTHQSRFMLGGVADASMLLNDSGRIVADCIQGIPEHFPRCTLDVSVVMPNHLHFIVFIEGPKEQTIPVRKPEGRKNGPKRGAVSAIVGSVKSAASKLIRRETGRPTMPIWQRDYYEHVIRSEREMLNIQEYIVNNPLQWELDRENPDRTGEHPMDGWLYGE